MPQLSLYIDKEILHKIEKAAKIENLSISKWVSSKLKKILDNSWPNNYFELFGSIDDETFTKPDSMKFEDDVKRESI